MVSFPTYQPERPEQLRRAKTMRKAITEPEKRLWWALRHQLPDFKFRRQFVIGPYIADFCCLPARLVVEVDGNQHGTDEALAFDARRTGLIESHDFRVFRFSNHDVLRSLDSVLDTIAAAANPQAEEIAFHG